MREISREEVDVAMFNGKKAFTNDLALLLCGVFPQQLATFFLSHSSASHTRSFPSRFTCLPSVLLSLSTAAKSLL